MSRPVLGFVGAGKVGKVLARLWHEAGYEVVAICSRTPASAAVLANQVNARVVLQPLEVIRTADLTFLTVPDDAIGAVVQSASGTALRGKAVVHVSGAHDAHILTPLQEQGASIGSLHPAFAFADVESALRGLPGSTFALEADDEVLRGWLRELVEAVHGRVLDIPRGGKAQYHAALVMLSNYTVTLYSLAERLLSSLGADQQAVDGALNALLESVQHNLRYTGLPWALTGPLTRADAGTIRLHLAVLKQADPDLSDLYIKLARQTYPILEARGVNTAFIEKTLQQDEIP
ncbi:MAG: DUF2520 domain-containing protein [bacterium]|nr:DUF2520 domain-containing protein [bacterium]